MKIKDMKVAFHFNADDPSLGCLYGETVNKMVFNAILRKRNLNLMSKVFIGDLLLDVCASEAVVKESDEEHTCISYRMDDSRRLEIFEKWLTVSFKSWNTLDAQKLIASSDNNIYVVCFESIDNNNAKFLDNALKNEPSYLGAVSINEASAIHWNLYGSMLIPLGRIVNRQFTLFYDEDREAFEPDIAGVSAFDKVGTEKLNFKYTIFDKYHDYQHARRIAEWKDKCGSMLAFVADEAVSRLLDVTPEIGDKLWSALTCFESAETNEQYAQVAVSCRRIFEYVVDAVAPVSDHPTDTGHSIKKEKYKNRLFEYARQCKMSDTNIDTITIAADNLSLQWNKLHELANKGVHAEVYRSEVRRCFIRTILLLDDIIAMHPQPFDIRTDIDLDIS